MDRHGDDSSRPDPASSRQPRPWQYSLLEVAIVVTAVCVWLGVWRFGGTTWAQISILVSGPLVGLGLVDYGLRHKSDTAQWLGRGVLYLWPLVLILLLLPWFFPH